MGVATLMIIACHAPASGVVMPRYLSFIFTLGNYGVDIFLLLSGLGTFYSLSKHPAISSWGYYKKRFERVFVPYLIIFIPYCAIKNFLGVYTLGDSLLSLSTLEYWLYHRGAWFVSLILVLYLFSPLLYRVIETKYKWLFIALTIIAIIAICNLFTIESKNSVSDNVLSAFGRVPSFLLGFGLGQSSKDGKKVSIWWLLLLLVNYLVLHRVLSITYGTEWIIVPIILVVILALIRWCKGRCIDAFLNFLGKISLESYLTNISINSILRVLIPTYYASSLFDGRYLEYLFVIIAGIAIAYWVNRLSKRIETEM
jgi:hypothetical protein